MSEESWFDERKEANIIASKRKYDDIYDAAVTAFKQQREDTGHAVLCVIDKFVAEAQKNANELTKEGYPRSSQTMLNIALVLFELRKEVQITLGVALRAPSVPLTSAHDAQPVDSVLPPKAESSAADVCKEEGEGASRRNPDYPR